MTQEKTRRRRGAGARHRRWTEEEENLVAQLTVKGASLATIAYCVERTRGAVDWHTKRAHMRRLIARARREEEASR